MSVATSNRISAAALPSIFVSTGSTSSDVMLAPVLAELQRRRPLGPVVGVGGAPLRDLGVDLMFDTTPASTVGIVNSLYTAHRYAGSLLKMYRGVGDYFRVSKPSLVILVDNPAPNLRLLGLAERFNIPVLYYIPPEAWSLFWWQMSALMRGSTLVTTIFQSETSAFKAYGDNVRWIGHPAVDMLQANSKPPEVNGSPTIGIFPGSRRHEVSDLLPIMRGAAEIILRKEPKAKFLVCSANDVVSRAVREQLRTWSVPVELMHRQSHATLSRCDLVLTCSGTATLEAALLDVPMVAMYRVHRFIDRCLQKWLLKSYFFALPNHILGRRVVPELAESTLTAEHVAAEGLALLRDQARRNEALEGLRQFRAALGPPGAVGRAVDIIESMLDGRRDAAVRCPREKRLVANHG